jgi:hypothetical protein
VPLSPRSLFWLGQVRRAILDPGFRASGQGLEALPVPLVQALEILDDGDFQAARAALGVGRDLGPAPARARVLRRDLLCTLRARYPEALAAFRAAREPLQPDATPFFMVNVVAGPCANLPFEDLEAGS